jgi:hypothetical protein
MWGAASLILGIPVLVELSDEAADAPVIDLCDDKNSSVSFCLLASLPLLTERELGS